jgi:membrane fusion protein, multidrug efflux system
MLSDDIFVIPSTLLSTSSCSWTISRSTSCGLAPGQRVSAGEVGRLVLSEPLGERGFWAPVTAPAEARRGLWSVRELVPADGGYALEPRVVEIIHVEGERAYLRGAVAEGAMILASGVQRAAPGQRVRPMPQTGPESAS